MLLEPWGAPLASIVGTAGKHEAVQDTHCMLSHLTRLILLLTPLQGQRSSSRGKEKQYIDHTKALNTHATQGTDYSDNTILDIVPGCTSLSVPVNNCRTSETEPCFVSQLYKVISSLIMCIFSTHDWQRAGTRTEEDTARDKWSH